MAFYGIDIDTPLSKYLNSHDYGTSPLAALAEGSNLEELRYHPRWPEIQAKRPGFVWRVVGAYYSQEDTTVTRFRAYGMHREELPYASFGVNHGDVTSQIDLSKFEYHPWNGNRYYVPIDNQIDTPNSGGYFFEVLDTEYPSEGMKFGMRKGGNKHECLVISFSLLPFNPLTYPNDLE